MRTIVSLSLALVLIANVARGDDPEELDVSLKTTKDQASYAIGLNIGRDLKANALDVNPDALIKGIRDILGDVEPSLSDEQCRAALTEFVQSQRQVLAEQRRAEGDKNKREGVAFLAANKGKEGVVTLPSGLQYKVLKSGNGPSPKATDRVQTHYHGTLLDGTVFDSSVERKEPIEFDVGGVIRGWTEALQLMKVGDKWQLFIPSELAYGAEGAGSVIGPHETLIFEVELLEIR